MTELHIGLAGVGYWGSKLARNVASARGGHLAAIADPDERQREQVLGNYREARGLGSVEELVADPELDAVVLATPASKHAEHARAALRAGKHVLVEKPLALATADCDELVALAAEVDRTLMVGHTFLYSQPVRMLRRLMEEGDLGRVLYTYAQRVNLGVIREDLNAMWNFGPHDVSIFLYLLGGAPVRVSARQFGVLNRRLEDVAFLILEFPGGVVGHIHESWLDPRKVRELTVVGDQKMVVYDDTDVESPLRIYDKGVAPLPHPPGEGNRPVTRQEGFGEFKLQVRAGDIVIPRVDGAEPLRTEIEHFIECAQTGATPLSDGVHGRQVVAVLEAAELSAREGGRVIELGEVAV